MGELHDENVSVSLYDRDRFVVPGHHHHVVVALALHRALRTQPVEVRVRIGDELAAAEEVDRVVVAQGTIDSSVVPIGPIGFRPWSTRR